MALYKIRRPLFDSNGALHEAGTLLHFEEGKQPKGAIEVGKDPEPAPEPAQKKGTGK